MLAGLKLAGVQEHHPATNVRKRVFEFEIVETGRTKLYIVNALGQNVLTILDDEIQKGRRKIKVDISQLASGVYNVILQTPTKKKSVNLNIIK